MIGVIFIVYPQNIVTNFNGSNACHIAVAIDMLELPEVKFLLFEDSIIIHLILWLLRIELVLKDMNLIIERLELVKECTLAIRSLNLGFFLSVARALI